MDATHENAAHAVSNTILIVDDEDINREILANLFEEEFQTEEAENGVVALQKVLTRPQEYCAILLDVVMDEMDGLQMLEHLVKADIIAHVPVFLITAETSSAVTEQAYQLGVMDVIRKPIVPFVVKRRVESVIELFQARRRLSYVVERSALGAYPPR